MAAPNPASEATRLRRVIVMTYSPKKGGTRQGVDGWQKRANRALPVKFP
jgi:hypothetical protein